LLADYQHISASPSFYQEKRKRLELSISAILIMSNTVASNTHTEEPATLNDDAPLECDTTPVIPINVISHLVLPFVQDRRTWNAVCSANKELYEASMRRTPPWPETKVTLMGQSVRALKFSPCGSFLASGTCSYPYSVHVCDRRGRQTCLTGHTSAISLLSFSSDGKYLASAGPIFHGSIRLWPTNSAKLPQQSDKMLRGDLLRITCLDFSPDDSNILVSADYDAIKLWNVEQEVCIYTFNHSHGTIRSLCFPAVDEGNKCVSVTSTGSLIRTCWDDLSGITSDIVSMPGLGKVQASTFSHCGSLLAAVSPGGHAVTLYSMRAMAVVQRLPVLQITGVLVLAFSPDGKTLVLPSNRNEIHVCEVHDLNIKRRLVVLLEQEHTRTIARIFAVAFDPNGKFLASADGECQDVRLWSL
jgi:WD40 repeat protein